MVINAREEKSEKELLMLHDWMEMSGNSGVDMYLFFVIYPYDRISEHYRFGDHA